MSDDDGTDSRMASDSNRLVPSPPAPRPERERGVAADRSLTGAVVSTQQLWHGGEEQAALLARGLRRRGHRAILFARHDGVFAERMEAGGCEVVRFRGNGRSPASWWQTRAMLRRVRPEVLHYNDPHAITSGGLASMGLGIGARVAMRHVCFPIRSVLRYRAFCDRVVCVSHAVAEACRRSGIPA